MKTGNISLGSSERDSSLSRSLDRRKGILGRGSSLSTKAEVANIGRGGRIREKTENTLGAGL